MYVCDKDAAAKLLLLFSCRTFTFNGRYNNCQNVVSCYFEKRVKYTGHIEMPSHLNFSALRAQPASRCAVYYGTEPMKASTATYYYTEQPMQQTLLIIISSVFENKVCTTCSSQLSIPSTRPKKDQKQTKNGVFLALFIRS